MKTKHFKPVTISGIGMILLCILLVLALATIGVAVFMEETAGFDENLDFIFMIIAFSLLGLAIISPILFEFICVKVNGRGVWTRTVPVSIGQSQQEQIVSHLKSKGYMLTVENDVLVATREVPGAVSCMAHIKIDVRGSSTILEVYRLTFDGRKRCLIFGAWGMMFKRFHRKRVAEILTIINAPRDIKV
ncbi:MAG: hypothetical protein FWE13_05350 [Firmicutes bacterium]|nr:hypothetical protein [Bacillota bacterium]